MSMGCTENSTGKFQEIMSIQSAKTADYDITTAISIDSQGHRFYSVIFTTMHQDDGHLSLSFPTCPQGFSAEEYRTGMELGWNKNTSEENCEITIFFPRVLGKNDVYTVLFEYNIYLIGDRYAIQQIDDGTYDFRSYAGMWGGTDPWTPRPTRHKVYLNLPKGSTIYEIYGDPETAGENRLTYSKLLLKDERLVYGARFSAPAPN